MLENVKTVYTFLRPHISIFGCLKPFVSQRKYLETLKYSPEYSKIVVNVSNLELELLRGF